MGLSETKFSKPRRPSASSRVFRPSATIPKGQEAEYVKMMKNLGFKKAHSVEGAKSWILPGKKSTFDAFRKFALRHAGKAANVAKIGGIVGKGLLGATNIVSTGVSAAIGIAGAHEGVKALKLHSEQKMNRLAQERKYGTVERATKTRKRLQKRKM